VLVLASEHVGDASSGILHPTPKLLLAKTRRTLELLFILLRASMLDDGVEHVVHALAGLS
jgi:hypothetical protein